MTRQAIEADVRAIERRCKGPLAPEAAAIKAALIADGRFEEAAAEDAAGRAGCGYDFNDVILTHPLDGALRTVACPACGQAITYRAPVYPSAE